MNLSRWNFSRALPTTWLGLVSYHYHLFAGTYLRWIATFCRPTKVSVSLDLFSLCLPSGLQREKVWTDGLECCELCHLSLSQPRLSFSLSQHAMGFSSAWLHNITDAFCFPSLQLLWPACSGLLFSLWGKLEKFIGLHCLIPKVLHGARVWSPVSSAMQGSWKAGQWDMLHDKSHGFATQSRQLCF